jgi:acyl-CoA synthetase (NDP forming)
MTEHNSFPAQALFQPQSVAVVGVPRGPKVGQIFLQGLLHPGYKGRIYPINPNADEVLGLPCYPSISALPETPDLAILVVGSETAIDVIGECADRGVKAAALFTAGFSEAGTEEGRQREAALLAAARRGARPVRLLGPNCMGVYVPKTGLAMFPGMPSEIGPVGFVSQSGSLCAFIAGEGHARGLAFSKVVSIGNQADLTAADFFEYLADDPETKVVGSYLEGVRDGRGLFRALERCASRKPVVIWKSGRTEAGARAAHSHTAALSGERVVWSAMLRQVGALVVHDMDGLLDLLVASCHVPRNCGKRIAILAGPGGPAVSASDACEENGLELPQLAAGTQEVLRGIIPMAGTSVRNPIDMGLVMLGAAEMYYRATEAAALDPNVDAILAISGSAGVTSLESFATAIEDIAQRTGKPIMQSSVGGEMPFERVFSDHGIATFGSPERALWAYARVTGHAP